MTDSQESCEHRGVNGSHWKLKFVRTDMRTAHSVIL